MLTIVLVVFALLLAYARFVEPSLLFVRQVDVPVAGLPENLAGYRILLASDLHSRWFGPDQSRIAGALARLAGSRSDGRAFDLAVFAGDMVDAHNPNPEPGRALLALLASQAPTFVALGNHDEVNLSEVTAAATGR